MPPVLQQSVARQKGHKNLKKCQYNFILNNGTWNRALECTTFHGCSRTQLKPSLKTAWKTQNGDTWTRPRTTGTGQRSNFYHQQWLGKFKGLPLQGPTNEQGPRVKLHVLICSAGAIPMQVPRWRGLLVQPKPGPPPPARQATVKLSPSIQLNGPTTFVSLRHSALSK